MVPPADRTHDREHDGVAENRNSPQRKHREEDRSEDLVAEDLAGRSAVHAGGDELRAHLGFAEAPEPARGGVADASGERVERTPACAVLGAAGALGHVPVRPDLIQRRDALGAAEVDDQNREPPSEEKDSCDSHQLDTHVLRPRFRRSS